MSDNSEYWKELLGDGYDPDVMRSLGEIDERYAAPLPEPPDPIPDGDSDDTDTGDESFDISFDFESEYRDVPDDRPLRRRREKRTGCLGGLLYAVFIIALSILLASLGWIAASDVLGFGEPGEPVNLNVPKNFTMDSIAKELHESGLIKYEFLFKLYAGFSNADKKIEPGTYELKKNYDYRALVYGMSPKTGARVQVQVVIPEGYTMTKIFELLEKNGVCTGKELWDTAQRYDFDYAFLDKATIGDKKRLEGYLFPDTYKFYLNDTPVHAISKMLDNFKLKFTKEYLARAEDMEYSVNAILSVAAMIEREAGVDEERARIASVIYNRLKSADFMHLQIDATIYYAIEGTDIPFSKEVDSPYNTYICEGLPPGPICNPGMNSIRAALYPETTKYYYYALGKEKKHEFFKDIKAFNSFVSSDAYGG